MSWKRELDALVKETVAFVRTVHENAPVTPLAVNPSPSNEASPALNELQQPAPIEPAPEATVFARADVGFASLAQPLVSEREEILRRVEEFRERQQARRRDQDAHSEREMARIRAMLDDPKRRE